MYKILIVRSAEKSLKPLNRNDKNKITLAISSLTDNPRPDGCKKVKSEPGVWRIRSGDWRIGYWIDDDLMEVKVIRIAHRREFYE